MPKSSIRAWLIKRFTTAILIPSLVTAAVGTTVIRQKVYSQAQAQVDSDLKGAGEIWQNYTDRLKDAIRIHATRMVIYRALDQRDAGALHDELERVREAEGLDILTLTDSEGCVFYRTRNPAKSGDSQADDQIVRTAMKMMAPVAGAEIVTAEELALESPVLARQALMEITPTPKAEPSGKVRETSGMVLKAAAPVFYAGGRRFLGVLYGAILVNRNYEIADKVRKTVFREEMYGNREVGTATIFQDDVRISTNVRNADGSRAITTRVSAEVAEEVLRRGRVWRGRAFVVNDWYMSAYQPIHDIENGIIGMLYVGTLERPFEDGLWRALLIFLGIALLGVALVCGVAITIAGSISRPIHDMAEAAKRVAEGDYSAQVSVTSKDEIGYLAECFNRMVRELSKATQELRQLAENLESKVEERTAQLKAMQGHLIQTEKLAAIGKLAAGVAHEINNPLTGILTNSSLMLQDLPSNDARRDDLQIIVDETLRCRKIVKGLLDFARQTKPQKQAVDLNVVLEDVFNLVRNQASFHDIELELDQDRRLPAVMADKDQMRQVVLNIVLNAAEAMPNGGKIRASTRSDPQTNQVQISVQDNGPGIPDEVKSKIFEPFFTTKRTGTGLGLAIAYGIMERHKGAISIDSTPGRGTTISLRIPAQVDDADD
ncbi:MAG TPA: cache domain-containing protein [Acidobacteriota bacterium]|nr:cache domain-containing protein [Acidobacteriota bacterium]